MAKTERIQNMTKGSPAKLIFTFAIPLMLGNVFQQFYTVVDTAIVGQALGVNALAALGAADWLNWLVLGLIQGFAQGFSIYMAQRFGAEDHEGLNRSIGATISLSAVISILTVILSQVAMAPVLRAMNTPEEIIGGAFTYLRIMFAGIPIIMAYNVLASILRALGDSKTPLYAMVIASILNIGLDLLFVMVFHWGIAGAPSCPACAAFIASRPCAEMICMTASACARSIFPFKNARRVNSPGAAETAPAAKTACKTAFKTNNPPWQESSTTSSPVKLCGAAKTVATHSSRRSPSGAYTCPKRHV